MQNNITEENHVKFSFYRHLSKVFRFAGLIRGQTSLNHTFRSTGPQIRPSEKGFLRYVKDRTNLSLNM